MQGSSERDERPAPFITEVRLQLTKEPPILAFASITLWNAFIVHDLRLLERRDGTRVVLMPRCQAQDGHWSTIAHPVREETRRAIERAVLRAYERCAFGQSSYQAAG